MRLTERQARIRLGAAIAAAGGQTAFAQSIGLKVSSRSTCNAVGRSIRGPGRIHPACLAALGLRRDEAGDIHTVEPTRIRVAAIEAEGDAGVRLAASILTAIGSDQ